MKKYILFVLLLGGALPVFVGISGRGRPWDILGYHDGGTWGWLFPLIIIVEIFISHDDKKNE